jgi:hypothetical protein
LLVDQSKRQRLFFTVGWVERLRCAAEQAGQPFDAGLSAGRTLIDVCRAAGERLGVRPATGKAAFRALGLRQQIVDLVNQMVEHALKGFRRKGAGIAKLAKE